MERCSVMIRKIDELGRIVFPAEMRMKLSLRKEDDVNIECIGDKIILSKANPDCYICHSIDNKLFTINNVLICSKCIKEIKAL